MEPGKNGADFSLRTDKGYLTVGQITYRHGQEREGLITPGGISFGSYYESSSFTYLSNPNIRNHGNYGYYLMADKMIYKGDWPEYEGPSHLRSGAKMAESLKKPHDPQLTALPPNRNRDVTAFCFILGHFSDKLEGQSNEVILELDHRFQLGPWCYVDDALVLGFEASFDF